MAGTIVRALRHELLIYDNLLAERKDASKIANRRRYLQEPFNSFFLFLYLFASLARFLNLQHEGSRGLSLVIPRAIKSPSMCAF